MNDTTFDPDQKAELVRERKLDKFQKAMSALFSLEEELGPYGDPIRHDVYRVRCQLGLIRDQCRNFQIEPKAEPETKEPGIPHEHPSG